MKMIVRIFILLLFCSLLSKNANTQTSVSTAKPWTYWWWMGSAVDSINIKTQLDYFAKTGLGGVHIIPIYGAKGFEEKYLPFMSEKWLELVHFTQNQAHSLGLGVDITLGTGWPYGGPMINQNFAAAALEKLEFIFLATDSLRIPLDSLKIKAFPLGVLGAKAENEKGEIIWLDLNEKKNVYEQTQINGTKIICLMK
jgi:hypothetical protein